MSEWMPIKTAKLGQRVLAYNRCWRSPFPAIVNGDYGAVFVDCPQEKEPWGWQAHATHWMPLPDGPTPHEGEKG